jgi:hypothetical protein
VGSPVCIVVMIRLATGHFHRLFDVSDHLSGVCVRYLSIVCVSRAVSAFPDITTMKELTDGLVEPKVFPHVAVYYPRHASFEMYDLIVILYEAPGKMVTRGYQLKEGRRIPEKGASDLCEHSFVIREFAAQSETMLRGWHVASDDEIESFLGVSGSSLAPKQWRLLKEKE